MVSGNFKLKGTYYVYINDDLVEVKNNLIVDVGKAEVAKLLGNGLGGVSFGYVAIGTGTTAPTSSDVSLEAEYSRQAATVTIETTTISNDTVVYSADFSFTEAVSVTEAGIFNADTGGTMLSRVVFDTAKNVDNGDTLKVIAKIQVL